MSDRLRDLEIGFATLSATLTTKIDALTTDLMPERRDVESRLRAVEAKLQRATGMALVGGGALGTVGGVVVSWLLGQ